QMDYQRPENPKQHNVIIGNRGLSGRKLVRPVVKLHIERGQITSSDIHLLKVTARVDELEVSVDDTLITTMLGIMETMMPDMQTMTAAGFPISSVEAMQRQAGVPMLATSDQIPKAATIFQIDQLHLGILWLRSVSVSRSFGPWGFTCRQPTSLSVFQLWPLLSCKQLGLLDVHLLSVQKSK
ncbi:unnamed protein product, partial [Effrenium voratum]